jgi:virulence factor
MSIKVGIIGLGDIATKAYLPVLSTKRLEVHLFTRNHDKLSEVGRKYRFPHLHPTLTSLMNSGIQAAFVHTAASAHFEIVQQLLSNNIHVYVDKPLAFHYGEVEKLVALANEKNLIVRVGFNRRYAPAYANLKLMADPGMIIMQKNRNALPGEVRKFIFEDFIHVVDTLLFLFPHRIRKLIVNGKKRDGLLYHVVMQLIAENGSTAIGVMNRDSGTTEEKLEVFTSSEKRQVYNLSEALVFRNKDQVSEGVDDWTQTLYKRGFEQIVDNFLQSISDESLRPDTDEILLTHEICEDVVNTLDATS